MKKLKPPDTDVLLKVMQIADVPQNLDAMQYVVFQFDFKDYEQFILECPPGSIRFNNVLRVAVFCDNLGVLVDGGAIDSEILFELYPIPWQKLEPVINGMRRELIWPDLFDYFEKVGKLYQKWWEPKAKKMKLPEAPKTDGAKAPLRPAARPTLVQATRFARPGAGVPARPAAAAARPGIRPGIRPGVRPGVRPGLRQLPRPSRPVKQTARKAKATRPRPKRAAKKGRRR